MEERGASQRRVCGLLGWHRSTIRYRSGAEKREQLLAGLRELARARVRWGYRRLHQGLLRQGWVVSRSRVYRLYRRSQLGLQRRRSRKRRVTAAGAGARPAAVGCNQVWTMDFLHDRLTSGRRFRVFDVLDQFSRECLAFAAEGRLRGEDVVGVLERVQRWRGVPEVIVVDNGGEFRGGRLAAWAQRAGVRLHFSRPGQPTDNPFIESFHGRLRDECLNLEAFEDLEEVRTALEAWRQDYNHNRPHSSLGWLTPAEKAAVSLRVSSVAPELRSPPAPCAPVQRTATPAVGDATFPGVS